MGLLYACKEQGQGTHFTQPIFFRFGGKRLKRINISKQVETRFTSHGKLVRESFFVSISHLFVIKEQTNNWVGRAFVQIRINKQAQTSKKRKHGQGLVVDPVWAGLGTIGFGLT